jgi:hypothetical protein
MASASGDECLTVDPIESLERPCPVCPIDFLPNDRRRGEGTVSNPISGVCATMRDDDAARPILVGVSCCIALV